MPQPKKLPDAEFEIMKVVWAADAAVTTSDIMERLGKARDWKIQTVVTLMQRLTERGFLSSEKLGRERAYRPLVDREDYLQAETSSFLRRYHDGSFLNLVTTLYDGAAVSDEALDELLTWVKKRRG